MSTENKKRSGISLWLLPIATAAPILAAAAFGVIRFGPKIHKLLNILIKLVVKA
ncbi:MAG: hypothetical protein ABTA22_01250 [Clostridia bacterium]